MNKKMSSAADVVSNLWVNMIRSTASSLGSCHMQKSEGQSTYQVDSIDLE